MFSPMIVRVYLHVMNQRMDFNSTFRAPFNMATTANTEMATTFAVFLAKIWYGCG